MPERPPDSLKRKAEGYERTDVRVPVLVGGLAGTLLVLALAFVAMYGLFRLSPPDGGEPSRETALPPEPRLETMPRNELLKILQRERNRLHEYRWVDADAGVVQIPIEQAMRLLEEEGLQKVESRWKEQ